jgi:hypothetical protein
VEEPSGNVIESATINIPDGESRITLNFEVPGPGQYGLRVQSGDPQLWRDGNGSNPNYPFALGNLGEIVESTAGTSTAFYYFFYDWEVQELATLCESNRVQVTVDITVGIDENDLSSLVNVYPVPANDVITFDLSAFADRAGMAISIMDASGRTIREEPVGSALVGMDTKNISAGSYHYAISSKENLIAIGKFVVMH